MADSSLADYIKTNKIRPFQRGAGATNKGPKKPGTQKNKKQQGAVKKVQNKKQQGGVKKTQNKKQQGGVKKQQGGIKKAKNIQRGGFKAMRGQATRGRGQARGNWRPRAADNVARTFQTLKKPAPVQTGGPGKITISNLDFGVSEQDLKELFSEIGSLKKAAIHFNAQGKSMGVADLVYARRADALKAIKQYNDVALDGRQMKMRLEGQTPQAVSGMAQRLKLNPVKRLNRGAAPVRGGRGGQRGTFRGRGGQRGASRGRGAARGQKSQRGQGATRGRGTAGRGRGGNKGNKKVNNNTKKQKQQKPKPVTVEELDAQLDAYINSKDA